MIQGRDSEFPARESRDTKGDANMDPSSYRVKRRPSSHLIRFIEHRSACVA